MEIGHLSDFQHNIAVCNETINMWFARQVEAVYLKL